MSDLLERLRDAGIPLDETTVLAMEDIDPSDFTDYNLEPFWHDTVSYTHLTLPTNREV